MTGRKLFVWWYLSFYTYVEKNFFFNKALHAWKEGGTFWKINPFLCFQICHEATKKISRKPFYPKLNRASTIIWKKFRLVCQSIPRCCQHLTLNGRVKNRCCLVSLCPPKQRIRSSFSLSQWCRSSISIVLSLSLSMSQAKTLIIITHFVFHNQMKGTGGCMVMKFSL